MIATILANQWLYARLSSDPVLAQLVGERIYSPPAPPGAELPFVLYRYQAGYDVRGVGATRIMTDLVYQVQVVGRGASVSPLQPIADRLDVLLQGASGSVGNGRVLTCVREQPIAYPEVVDGVTYHYVGGLWRILVQEA